MPPVPTVHELLATLELGETALPSPADAAVGWPDPDATLDAVFGRFRVLGEIGRVAWAGCCPRRTRSCSGPSR